MSETSLQRRSHGGHVMAQVAACQRAVGVATIARPRLFELRGGVDDLGAVAWMLSRQGPLQGQTVRLGWGWWLLDAPHRALVLEDPSSPGQLQPFLDGLDGRHPDVAVTDISDAYVGVVIAGRLARSLTASAAARVPEPAVTAFDGDDYWLLVLRRELARGMPEVLLQAGRFDGAVAVEIQAAELYRAARRVHPTVASASVREPFTDSTTTGAPSQ
jgi:hypothetical protein